MPTILQTILAVPALGLLILTGLFALEVAAACLPGRRRNTASGVASGAPADLAVLVPAHDEAGGIAGAIENLRAQAWSGVRILVVADNCRDETARIARGVGAEVIERFDSERRGKGYALDFGLRHLATNPPAVVVVVDADCRLAQGALARLHEMAVSERRPVQGCYLMRSPPEARIGMRVAELAFLVKNRVRPAGLQRMGLPCHLTGSGMAFPWALIRDADLAHSSLVEDMRLGLDLALTGSGARFCEDALILSDFPMSERGAQTQRRRWEEGHLGMIALAARHIARAVRARRPASAMLALDTMIPPLTLLILVVGAFFVLVMLAQLAFGRVPLPLAMASGALGLLVGSLFVAWVRFGRAVLPMRLALHVLPYAASKAGMYARMALGSRSAGWIRTDRDR
ncbi:glycosyltransferase family 2 protein [Aureimonas sp. ME7]|uniref:glycosyltransferase family 2 protein n=1 Tax=Aureimonas sp. ME7 TaxID=2744252 RepID=UPI0015F4A064|nr:glycosyltransferase family 2 protein [Aureimonas sp. ME7]